MGGDLLKGCIVAILGGEGSGIGDAKKDEGLGIGDAKKGKTEEKGFSYYRRTCVQQKSVMAK